MTAATGDSPATTSILFVDVRNSTLFIDNYDESAISEILDILFQSAREFIREHGGTVDKIIGDGLMAVFDGGNSGRRAVTAAVDIYRQAVRDAERQTRFSAINIGIGIATGPVQETTLAEIDETVIGRAVNVAARLQGLCKKYDLSILVDRPTHDNLREETLPDSYAVRHIPNQTLRGIRSSIDTYNICDTTRLDKTYIETFNEGIRKYLDRDFDDALTEFTKAYTRQERYTDQTLLNEFTNACLDNLTGDQELFRNPDRYEEHSDTQESQAFNFEGRIRNELRTRDDTPEWILDVGCGTGKVTESVLKHNFPQAHIVGIDPSKENIAMAQAEHAGSDLEIEYRTARIERYAPEQEHGKYDLIFSNSSMHWIDEQDRAYENLRKLVAEDGLLAIHQGAKGTYQELHQVTVELIDRYDWRHHFENLNPPLDLTYYDEDEMRALLNRHGFEITQFTIEDDSQPPDTIIEDFAEASLNAYCERLDTDSQRDVFREEFKRVASEKLEPSDISVRRIYLIAEPESG
jgi:class 3 adenylate cyclase/trans-aconitate methyltransferase